MRNRIAGRAAARYRWDRLKVSFWFAPAIMAVFAVLLAWTMYYLDGQIPNDALASSRFVLAGTSGEMRTSLLGMAGTVLATAGVVFTLLTLPLSTVVAQYGSRLLRLFLGDRTAQFVLGMFVATFVYCMAAALSIPPPDVAIASPQLTATVGLYLMLATFTTLILLVQHISTMLQAPNIAASAGAELRNVVDAEMPNEFTGGGERAISNASQAGQGPSDISLETEGYALRVKESGYIQYIDPDLMLAAAREKDLVIRLLHKPGHFVRSGVVVALVWPADRVDERAEGEIHEAFQIGNVRTPTQDVQYAVNQLVEMAVRAMSPAINDPFTAMTCLDHLGDGLAKFVRQEERGRKYYDREGRLRLVLEPVNFAELVDAAFDMLRHASCDNASVLLHMLVVIDVIGREAKAPEARQLLHRHVGLILAESRAGQLIEPDRESIHRRGEALLIKLEGAL